MNAKIKKICTDLGFLIIVAMVLGCVAGYLLGNSAKALEPLGTLFIQLIKMLVVPLIFISILSGSLSLGATKKAGKIALYTLLFIAITSFLAGALAAVIGVWFKPGSGISPEIVAAYTGHTNLTASTANTTGFWDTLLDIVPSNPIESLVNANILQIIFFSMFVGFGIGTIATDKKQLITSFIDGLLDALIWCIRVVMWTAPVGVFALMASAVGTMGFEIFGSLAKLLCLDLVAVFIIGLGMYPLCIQFLSNISVPHFLRAMLKPQMVALSTSSSLATLAVNMETCEQDLKISKETTSFVVPLGATINMTGNVIYYVLAAIFFSQFYGMDLSFGAYAAIVVTAVFSAIGQAGVPGPTFTLFAVFIAGGIPLEGIGILFAVDRLFDMIRTVLNITGDACCAAVVDRLAK